MQSERQTTIMVQTQPKYKQKTTPFVVSSFTGKERDSETGFSYFGARYYDSDILTGWLSVDPLADKYPNLSPYAYCAWNPVKLVDPDGRDAIYITFPDYRANGIPFTGHSGVLLIDNKTGVTKYYEYGRYNSNEYGTTRNVKVPNVIIGKDGKPTIESLNKVLACISKRSGHNGDIEGAYIISDKFKEMNDYAVKKMAETNNKYSLLSNNCATFAEDVITQDKSVDKPSIILNSPINIVDEYQEEGNARVYYNAKKNTTKIGKGNENDAKINKDEK